MLYILSMWVLSLVSCAGCNMDFLQQLDLVEDKGQVIFCSISLLWGFMVLSLEILCFK